MLKRDLQIVSGQRDRRSAERDGALEKNAVLEEELETLRRRVAGEEEWICPEGHRVSLRPDVRCADCHKPMVSLSAVPMADLLREHRKALVRAKNEGRRQAVEDLWADEPQERRTAKLVSLLEPESKYPCSPTCTHDDAAKPGHAERVRERSEAVKRAIPINDLSTGTTSPATLQAIADISESAFYQQGAEAMRAACLNAVQFEMEKRGASREEWEAMKSAIEGAMLGGGAR
jgi:hypothetical protein